MKSHQHTFPLHAAFFMGMILFVIIDTALADQKNLPETPYLELQRRYSVQGKGVGLDVAASPIGDIYLSSASQPGLWRLDQTTNRFLPLAIRKASSHFFPEAIEVDEQSRLWIADATLHQVHILSNNGDVLISYGSPNFRLDAPAALARFTGGKMAVWDKSTGALWLFLPGEDQVTARRLAAGPQCVAADRTIAYCLNADGRRVVKYSEDQTTAQYILNADSYAKIGEINFGPDNSLYLTDTGGKRFLSVSGDLKRTHRFMLYERLFKHPTRFAFHGNNLWLIDEGRQELLWFTLRTATTGLEHALLGEEYLVLSLYGPALRELDTALRLGHRNAKTRLLKGKALYGLKRYPEALDVFIHLQGAETDRDFWLGNTLFRLDRYGEALQSFQAALNSEPEDELFLFNSAQTLLALKRYKQAGVIFRQLMQREPNNLQAHLGLARALMGLRDYAGVIDIASELTSDKNVGREARHYLGLAYLQFGSSQKALPLLERAAKEGPYFKEALIALAEANRRLGYTDRATHYDHQVNTYEQRTEGLNAYLLEDTP